MCVPKGKGITLSVPSKQLVQFVENLSYVLLALEIAGRLAGLPVTHLSAIAKELTTAIPKDARKMISQFAETLKGVALWRPETCTASAWWCGRC